MPKIILEPYLDSKMAVVLMSEQDLIDTIKVLVQSYDHSIDMIRDIIVFSQKLEALLITGVEQIEV